MYSAAFDVLIKILDGLLTSEPNNKKGVKHCRAYHSYFKAIHIPRDVVFEKERRRN